MRISDWSSDVCSSDLAVEHKTALRLHRPSRQNRHVRGDAGIDLQLRQEPVQRDALNLCTNAYAHRAPLVMDAHGDDGALEPGIADTGHRKQQLAGEIGRVRHSPTIGPHRGRAKAAGPEPVESAKRFVDGEIGSDTV